MRSCYKNQMWEVFCYHLLHNAQPHSLTHFNHNVSPRGNQKRPFPCLKKKTVEAQSLTDCTRVSSYLRGEPELGSGPVPHVPSSSFGQLWLRFRVHSWPWSRKSWRGLGSSCDPAFPASRQGWFQAMMPMMTDVTPSWKMGLFWQRDLETL